MELKKPIVYVVDDDEEVASSLKWVIESEGYAVKAFNNANDFLKDAHFEQPSCLLLDVRMPKMNGLELQNRLIERKIRLPIIFLTGHGDVPMTVSAMKKGAFEFLLKPIKNDLLISIINKAIEEDIENRTEQYFNESRSSVIKDELSFAIEREEFSLVYQPIFKLKTLEIIGIEALIRWNHPKLGMVPPDEFIPIAESTGIIESVSSWVIQQACSDYLKLCSNSIRNLYLSINLSTNNLENDHFAKHLREHLEKTGVFPSNINFEITETALMTKFEQCNSTLRSLQRLGVSISIDDFGTGYSSLGYLKNLPINTLKIDKCFIKDLPADKNNAVIVRSVLTLAKNLGLKVTVEGVENKDQLKFLLQHQCDSVQGYYLCRPIKFEEVKEKIISSQKE